MKWSAIFLGVALCAIFVNGELLPIRTYTTADGLASDSIYGIVPDSRGFLWFCTTEGLSRFDGYRFTTYGADEGLPHRIIESMIETRSGDHWIGTPLGLSRITTVGGGPRFKNFRLAPEPAANNVSTFTILQFNTIALLLTLSCNGFRWGLHLLRLTEPDATGLPNHGQQTSFLCPRFCRD